MLLLKRQSQQQQQQQSAESNTSSSANTTPSPSPKYIQSKLRLLSPKTSQLTPLPIARLHLKTRETQQKDNQPHTQTNSTTTPPAQVSPTRNSKHVRDLPHIEQLQNTSASISTSAAVSTSSVASPSTPAVLPSPPVVNAVPPLLVPLRITDPLVSPRSNKKLSKAATLGNEIHSPTQQRLLPTLRSATELSNSPRYKAETDKQTNNNYDKNSESPTSNTHRERTVEKPTVGNRKDKTATTAAAAVCQRVSVVMSNDDDDDDDDEEEEKQAPAVKPAFQRSLTISRVAEAAVTRISREYTPRPGGAESEQEYKHQQQTLSIDTDSSGLQVPTGGDYPVTPMSAVQALDTLLATATRSSTTAETQPQPSRTNTYTRTSEKPPPHRLSQYVSDIDSSPQSNTGNLLSVGSHNSLASLSAPPTPTQAYSPYMQHKQSLAYTQNNNGFTQGSPYHPYNNMAAPPPLISSPSFYSPMMPVSMMPMSVSPYMMDPTTALIQQQQQLIMQHQQQQQAAAGFPYVPRLGGPSSYPSPGFPASASSADPNFQQLKRDLFTKVRNDRHAAVQEALTSGMPIDITDRYGNQLLHIACQNGNKRMVKLLLRWGADMNAMNHQGNTPLHFCFAYHYDPLAAYLISKGANDHMMNYFGWTCYDGLRPEKREEAIAALHMHQDRLPPGITMDMVISTLT